MKRALLRHAHRTEPPYVRALKALLYGSALVVYVHPMASAWAVAATVVFGLFGKFLARYAHRQHVRLSVGLVSAAALLAIAWLLDTGLRQWMLLPRLLGIDGALLAAQASTFGIGALSIVFVLRLLAHRVRMLSLLEVLFIAGAVVTMLADHRNRMLNRPRFLSDWAWSLGIDPTAVLFVAGACVALLSTLLFLREQPFLKLLSTVTLLMLLGSVYYLADYVFNDGRIIPTAKAADALGLSGDKPSRDGDRRRGKAGSRRRQDNPFKDDYRSSPSQPVAIAILRDDYEAPDGVIYFRQRVLSDYNGVHLTAHAEWDQDVIARLPTAGVLEGEASQTARAHTDIPTTMYLLVDHPQPPALTHARRIKLIDNPNPKQFVAAYEVASQVLSVPPVRLLGRRSIPERWEEARREHYTALPDDPRYRTLADMIVRGVDPRFADDDLARAFAIKRFLEREGFYTRRSSHASTTDPTASFLFGSLRGYCVHFAHAAVYLMRSQGIASRVALGYAVQTTKRAGGSTVLVMSDRAHAWPEVHLDGIGWVTFDIYPERTDMPLATAVDYDLEKLLGELARNNPTAGVAARGGVLVVPWAIIGYGAIYTLAGLLVLAFAVKIGRQLMPRLFRSRGYHRLAYRAVLDRLAAVGLGRRRGETRERHAARLQVVLPHLGALTEAHMAASFGSRTCLSAEQFDLLVEGVERDLRRGVSAPRRLLGRANPLNWLWSR